MQGTEKKSKTERSKGTRTGGGHPRSCGTRLPGDQRAPSRQPARRGRTKSGLECEGDGSPTPGSGWG